MYTSEGRVCNTVISGGKHIFSGIANKMSYDITAWAPKEEYDESCPSVIHRKCFLAQSYHFQKEALSCSFILFFVRCILKFWPNTF